MLGGGCMAGSSIGYYKFCLGSELRVWDFRGLALESSGPFVV